MSLVTVARPGAAGRHHQHSRMTKRARLSATPMSNLKVDRAHAFNLETATRLTARLSAPVTAKTRIPFAGAGEKLFIPAIDQTSLHAFATP
ncbi:hypothetical protein MSIMFB_01637 [Mycobacterium simulans]|uniref:Uncharacterized protein n=1 Tax=Mycobacterium simulans TaxID=627089 RepID=A0A7Z7N8V7_9MYCO|nr:hypothetical protein [Mycobacterium simulans]SOJ54140.1 hypothetical protein MSIMFB_01637 [Mycobacterium simulans]